MRILGTWKTLHLTGLFRLYAVFIVYFFVFGDFVSAKLVSASLTTTKSASTLRRPYVLGYWKISSRQFAWYSWAIKCMSDIIGDRRDVAINRRTTAPVILVSVMRRSTVIFRAPAISYGVSPLRVRLDTAAMAGSRRNVVTRIDIIQYRKKYFLVVPLSQCC